MASNLFMGTKNGLCFRYILSLFDYEHCIFNICWYYPRNYLLDQINTMNAVDFLLFFLEAS